MPYRPGDPTETFEAKVEKKLPKSYLVDSEQLGARYFVPFSQIVGGEPGPPDEDGNRLFEVTDWWWKKRGDFEAT